MKKKILQRSLALGALMVFVITGSVLAADEYGIHVTKDTVDPVTESQTEISKDSYRYGISAAGSKKEKPEVIAQVIAPNITFNVTNNSDTKNAIYGAFAQNSGGILLGSDSSKNVNIKVTNNYNDREVNSYGIQALSTSHGVTILGENITVSVLASKQARVVDAGKNVIIGSEATEAVRLEGESRNSSGYGILVADNASVTVNGQNITVSSKAYNTARTMTATGDVNIGFSTSDSIRLTSESLNGEGTVINTSTTKTATPEVIVRGKEIIIEATAAKAAQGSYSTSVSNVELGDSNTQKLTITATSSGDNISYGVRNYGRQTLLGQHIEVKAINTNETADKTQEIANGIVNSSDNGGVVVGDNSTREIIVSAQTVSSKAVTAVNNNKGNVSLTSNALQLAANSAAGEAVSVKSLSGSNPQTNITANDMLLTATGKTAYGVKTFDGATTLQTKNSNGKIAITADGKTAYGVQTLGGTTTLRTESADNTISITAQGTDLARGLFAQNAGSKIIIGASDEATLPDVTIKAISSDSTNEDKVSGILALSNGQIEVNAKTLDVETHADGDNWAYAIFAANNTVDETDNLASVDIVADTINVTSTAETEGHASGLVVMSQGIMNVEGNLTVTADDAIVARGDAVMRVNEDGKHSTKLNGDINFNYDKKTSGTKVDAGVLVNLTGADSYWDGNAKVSWETGEITPEDKAKVTGLELIIADGAQWNPGVINEYDNNGKGVERRAINKLVFDDGVINIKDRALASVETIDGIGGQVNFEVDDNLTGGVLTIYNGGEETTVTANYSVDADKVATKENFAKLVKETLHFDKNAAVKGIAHIEEGLLTPAMTGVTTNNINGNELELQNIQQASSTTTMDAMRDIASTAIIAWRQEDSTLSQRLGELRNSEGDQGVWVRMSRGEFEYSGAYKNQYNYFQMGYDKAYGAWHYGAAVSHNDGQTAYANGKGDNRSTSLSLYGTWLGEKGQYADIVLKQGRLSNEFEIHTAAGDTRGDYDAWGTSLSGEYGMKVDISDGWYVTPQAQLTFMRIGGEDYTTSNNIRVSQDTLYSTVGRVGFELGKKITDKGSVYAKASLLHEFAGDADTYLRLGDLHNSYSQDIGNTWYEAGLGFNYKTSANSYVYADVVKTFGDDIKTPWQWNAGMRWSF